MQGAQLRKELQRLLDAIQDEHILEAIYTLVTAHVGKGNTNIADNDRPMRMDEYYAMIDKAEEDIKAGKLFDEEHVSRYFRSK